MRKVDEHALWVGNVGDLRDARTLLAAGIEAIVELADSEPFMALPRQLIRCRFPMSDGGDNSHWLLRLAAESVATFLRNDVPVLICCSAGMSRSVCVAAAGLALAETQPLSQTLLTVSATGPVDISPGLLSQLQHALKRTP